MNQKDKPRKIETNIKKLLSSLYVHSDRVNEFQELSNFLIHARTFKINEFWRCQTNVPVLKLYYHKESKDLFGWVIYLADFGEIQNGMADVYYKGVISSSINFKNETPYASVINTELDEFVIISWWLCEFNKAKNLLIKEKIKLW